MIGATMKRLSASIPDKLFERLEELADYEGRSVSNLVSYLLERSIDERYKLHGRPDKKEEGAQ
jgi:metal-responsive CopG/Arc/MetJ family transcriptional regulator